MGCSRLGQSCSLLPGGVHQRRGTDPAGLGGSTGGSGGSPPEEKQDNNAEAAQRSKFTLNM